MVEHSMRGTYYGWAHMYLLAVRHQLNNARASRARFCFGCFLCALFFEKVPTLCLHRAVRDGGLQEPWMGRWCQTMVREGGDRVGRLFTEELLE